MKKKKLKILDLLLREVQDPAAQENFYRLRKLLEDLESNGIEGPQGPQGPPGPPGSGGIASQAPKLIQTFDTDVGTIATNLVKVSGTNAVTKIVDNSAAEIPYGIFGVAFSKPSPLQAEVIFTGIVSGYSGFTAGMPLFISTSGTPTHTAPTTGMVQQIGFAVDSTSFFLHLLQPIRRS